MRRIALAFTPLACAVLLLAAPSWEKKDFSQWTTDDAKKILSDSPWAKTTHLNLGRMSTAAPAGGGKEYLVAPNQAGGAQSGGQMGGAGQQQMPQRPSTGSTSPNGMGQPGQENAPEATMPRGTPVVIEWMSAVPIRLAELKLKAGDSQPSQADVEQAKRPVDSYMIALIGIPGPAQQGEDKEMASAATLTPKNKQPIQATSVKEQAMSGGTRAIVFTFPKSEQITDADKSVQFHLKKGPLPTDVKQNFKLKDMHYDGKLAL